MAKKTKRKFYDIICGDEDSTGHVAGILDSWCPDVPRTEWRNATYPFVRVFADEKEWRKVKFYLGLDEPAKVYFY